METGCFLFKQLSSVNFFLKKVSLPISSNMRSKIFSTVVRYRNNEFLSSKIGFNELKN